jgi:hypothetical protein
VPLNTTPNFKLPLPELQERLTPPLVALAYRLDEVLLLFGAAYWKAPVANFAALPAMGNVQGDVRQTLDTKELYTWTGAAWVLVSGATDYVGWFVQGTKPTAAQVPNNKWGFWYNTNNNKLRKVARYSGNLYGVQLSFIP